VALALAASGPLAQSQDLDDYEDPGDFEVLSAHHELIDGVYNIDASIYMRLSTDATRTLNAAVPLTIRIEAQFINRLRFWFDTSEFERALSYRLQYRTLSDRYIVHNIDASGANSDGGRTFTSLESALAFIGQVDDLPIVDRSLIDADRRYDIRVRAVLDKTELPGPVWLFAFMRKDWSIGSEWYTWRLDDG
jgi:hypothetical protein